MPEFQSPHSLTLAAAPPVKDAIGEDAVASVVAEAMTIGVVTVPAEEAPVPIGDATVTVLLRLDLVDVEEVDGSATRIWLTREDPVPVGFGMSGKGPPPAWVLATSGK